jgi:hypothetical protein
VVPAEQRLSVGAEEKFWLLDEPQEPLIVMFAAQTGDKPPYAPVHSQVQGPEPETDEAVPEEQRLEEGAK